MLITGRLQAPDGLQVGNGRSVRPAREPLPPTSGAVAGGAGAGWGAPPPLGLPDALRGSLGNCPLVDPFASSHESHDYREASQAVPTFPLLKSFLFFRRGYSKSPILSALICTSQTRKQRKTQTVASFSHGGLLTSTPAPLTAPKRSPDWKVLAKPSSLTGIPSSSSPGAGVGGGARSGTCLVFQMLFVGIKLKIPPIL